MWVDGFQNFWIVYYCELFTCPIQLYLVILKNLSSNLFQRLLKGQCHEIFRVWFFSWISFPQAPEYTIRAVSNFSKICGNIRSSRLTTGGKFATGINYNGGKFSQQFP